MFVVRVLDIIKIIWINNVGLKCNLRLGFVTKSHSIPKLDLTNLGSARLGFHLNFGEKSRRRQIFHLPYNNHIKWFCVIIIVFDFNLSLSFILFIIIFLSSSECFNFLSLYYFTHSFYLFKFLEG